jgi:hypothetical protein
MPVLRRRLGRDRLILIPVAALVVTWAVLVAAAPAGAQSAIPAGAQSGV